MSRGVVVKGRTLAGEWAASVQKNPWAGVLEDLERGEKIPDYVNKVLDEVIEYAKVRS